MKKSLFIVATAIIALASCSDESFVGNNSTTNPDENGTEAIMFASVSKGITRGDIVGNEAATKLGNNFYVMGTKGNAETTTPSLTKVFDNYLVHYDANTAGTTTSNTANWEYVGVTPDGTN